MNDEALGRRRRAARRAAKCWWCGEVAEYLCDTPLFPQGTKTVDALEHAETCDAPMCRAHARVVGFMCSGGPPSPFCGAPTAKGGECERVTGGGRCHQHAGVATEADDPEVHACPFCASLDASRSRDVDPAEHRSAARAHGWRSQMRVTAEPREP